MNESSMASAAARRRAKRRRRLNRPLQRGIIILPSALTLANLFFGFWAIVSAARGMYVTAAWLVVLAGVADLLDGRIARATRTRTRFGAELDSLVDAISFGVAPAVMIYFLFLMDGTWEWVAGFFFLMGVVVRLARFNIEQAGEDKASFNGLPSPVAGIALATFYPFSQTPLFQEHLATLPWPVMVTTLLVILSLLMMSNVIYPAPPTFSFRSGRGIIKFVAMLSALIAALTIPSLFFFPAALGYITFGIGRAAILGFLDRLPESNSLLDECSSGHEDTTSREIDYRGMRPTKRGWWRLRRNRLDRAADKRRRLIAVGHRSGSKQRKKEPRAPVQKPRKQQVTPPGNKDDAASPDTVASDPPPDTRAGQPPANPQPEERQ